MRTSHIIAISAAVLCLGCSKKAEEADKPVPEEKKKPGTIGQAIEGITGKTAVDQGRRAQQKIIEVSEKENRQLDEVLE